MMNKNDQKKRKTRNGKRDAKSQNQKRVDVLVVFALIVVIVAADHPPSHRHISEHGRRER